MTVLTSLVSGGLGPLLGALAGGVLTWGLQRRNQKVRERKWEAETANLEINRKYLSKLMKKTDRPD